MIILDTNVIMSFLLTKGITHQIIAAHKDIFITPEYCFEEIWEHKDVWNKKKLPDTELKKIIQEVQRLFIYPVSKDVYENKIEEASKLINDPDDVPIVALALAVNNEGIWTYDRHFFTKELQEQVKVLSTSDMVKSLNMSRLDAATFRSADERR